MKLRQIKRIIMMLIGVFLIGLSVGLFRISSMGTDPFTTMNLGISGFLNMQFGVYQLIVNIILFVVVWKYANSNIGIGTIINMVSVGFVADFIDFQFQRLGGGSSTLRLKIIFMIIAVIVAGFSVALYMTANMGIAPYDALAVLIEKVTRGKIPFSIARVLTDITCIFIGFSFGAIVGVSTVITAFFTGPIVQFFRWSVTDRLLEIKPNAEVIEETIS